MNTIKTLEIFGLSEKEAKILYSCMQIEGTRASEISKRTGIERTNVYKILDNLISRGFITVHKRENVTKYRGIEPDALLSILKQNVKDFEDNLSFLKTAYKDKVEAPRIEILSGRKAIRTALLYIINKNKPYSAFGGIEQAYRQNYLENLPAGLLAEESKVQGRIILSPNEKTVLLSNERYKISQNPLPKNVCTVICDNLVAIFNWGDVCNVIFIIDKKISEDYNLLFENLWLEARNISAKEIKKISLSDLKTLINEE